MLRVRVLGALVLAAKMFTSFGTAHAEMVQDDSLPTPKGLEQDVLFWERIFTEYTPKQCVLHDAWHLNVIYGVKNIPEGVSQTSRRLVRSSIGQIRKGLAELARAGSPRGVEQKRIYYAVPVELRTREFFRLAGSRVRCQRGVDLQPSFYRSQQYLPMIRQMLKDRQMPPDLAYLPHLESGFNIHARSRVGAKGLWQFMVGTARSEGLMTYRRQGTDFRTDPTLSTKAATNHLMDIFGDTKSWPLTITAYNYGENGIGRAIRKFGSDYMAIRQHHRTRIFGFAARNYYPSFLAVRNVARQFEKRGVSHSLPKNDSASARRSRGDSTERILVVQ